MKVSELKNVLVELEAFGWGDIPIWFSYDCRCAERPINRVDLETRKSGEKYLFFREEDNDSWLRRNKQDFERLERKNKGLFQDAN